MSRRLYIYLAKYAQIAIEVRAPRFRSNVVSAPATVGSVTDAGERWLFGGSGEVSGIHGRLIRLADEFLEFLDVLPSDLRALCRVLGEVLAFVVVGSYHHEPVPRRSKLTRSLGNRRAVAGFLQQLLGRFLVVRG